MVKFVYFDLGGVVSLDFSGTNNWEEVKREWKITDDYWADFESKLCVGKESISPEFLDAFVSRFKTNPFIWPVIDKTSQKCRVGLLTNMYPSMFAAIEKRGILPKVRWSVVIDSSIVGLAKPDPKIYRLAETKADARGREILFVENSPTNIEAAKSFGWQTFLYDSTHPEDSSKELATTLNKVLNNYHTL